MGTQGTQEDDISRSCRQRYHMAADFGSLALEESYCFEAGRKR